MKLPIYTYLFIALHLLGFKMTHCVHQQCTRHLKLLDVSLDKTKPLYEGGITSFNSIKISDLFLWHALRHVFFWVLLGIFIKNFSIWMMDFMIIMMTAAAMWRARAHSDRFYCCRYYSMPGPLRGSCLVAAADLVHLIKSPFLLTSCKDVRFLIMNETYQFILGFVVLYHSTQVHDNKAKSTCP